MCDFLMLYGSEFSAPEMQQHGGPLLTIIDNSIGIWSLDLIIIWCINVGHLGYLEIDNKLRAKYLLKMMEIII